ncbi:MAG: glycosyltransferase family 4 protein [Ignavibacteria bacterium]|jgi:glycosyltransferase involved in cell wall biosynthesis
MKTDILFTNISGMPSENSGGPNKIIFSIIGHLSDLNVSYCSKQNFIIYNAKKTILNKDGILNAYKAKIGRDFYLKSALYRKAVTSPFYLRYYFRNLQKSFHKNSRVLSYELLHSHDPISMFYFAEKSKKKKILTIHSKGSFFDDFIDFCPNASRRLDNELNKLSEMETISFHKADIVTFPSEAAKLLFLESKNLEDNYKIKIVYNGVDLKKINAVNVRKSAVEEITGLKEYEMFIFNVAQHVKSKRIEVLIDIVKKLNEALRKKVILINVGKGAYTHKYFEQIKKNNLHDRVFIIPSLPNNEIINLMKICDYFIMPSERVVFDLVILEALACGATVIASNNGGNKEAITNGYNGYLINEFSVDRVIEIIKNKKKEVTLNAVESVKRFSMENMVAGYKNIYDNIID